MRTVVSHPPTDATIEEIEAYARRLFVERGDRILNAIDDGIYCLDSKGDTVFINEAAARLLQYSNRELLGRPQHELIHHHYADGSVFPREACPIFLAVTEGIQQRVGGDVFWKKNGEKLWVDYTAIPIKEGRSILGVVVTFRDVSAEIAQRALADSEAHYRAALEATQRIFEQAPAAIATIEVPLSCFVRRTSAIAS